MFQTSSSLDKYYGQYKIGNKLGSGAFGDIYMGFKKQPAPTTPSSINHTNYNNNQIPINSNLMQSPNTKSRSSSTNNSFYCQKFAVKIQKANLPNPQLAYQAKLLNVLCQGIDPHKEGILKIQQFFKQGESNIMVTRLLGSSLQSLFKQHNRQFPLKTVIMIGLQALQRIRFVHLRGFIHRDIKPDNFLIGSQKEECGKIFLIDFGLAKRFIVPQKSHIAYKDNKSLTGTARYASVSTHLGVEQGRRDDLQSLIYMLIYMFHGQLPWQNMDAKDKKQKYHKILLKKLNTTVSDLCGDMPIQIGRMLRVVRGMRFDEEPNYQWFRDEMLRILYEKGDDDDGRFCWML